MFSVRLKCPHCGKEKDFSLHRPMEYLAREPVPLGTTSARPSQTVVTRTERHRVRAYGVAACPECNGPVLIWFECPWDALRRVSASSKDVEWRYSGDEPRILGTFPKMEEPDDSPYYPEPLRKVLIELQEHIQAKCSAPLIVIGCRGVLEVALKTLGYDGKQGPLTKRIDQARQDGILTESMRQWAHRIRLDGNEAVHELTASHEDASELVDFLRLFLEVAFVLPTRVPMPKE